VFNIVSSGAIDLSMRDVLARMDKQAMETLEKSPRAVSMVLDPTGTVISDVLSENEGILYADIDVAACVEPKQFHDVVGYYNRYDIFNLNVDRSPRDPAAFTDGDVPRDESVHNGGTQAGTLQNGRSANNEAPTR